MSLPKITIVVPCFNASSTLERTIQSLLIQDYPDLELILIDGKSKDNTLTIVKQYEAHFKYIVSEPDRGQSDAINKGFRLATGDLWGWLCADDELAPNALHKAVEIFNGDPNINMVTGGCLRIFSDGTKIETHPNDLIMERISYQNGIEQPSTFWKADLHRKAGELDESYRYALDWEWWNRLKINGAKLATTPVVLSHYYFSETNKTSTGANAMLKEMYQVIKTYGPLKGYLADIYMFLYKYFDLYGCYDRPPICSQRRQDIHHWVLKQLVKWFGAEYIYCYNWNFASKQERGLCWYK